MLTPDIVALIDQARASGRNYDEVVAAVEAHGVPEAHVETVLGQYRKLQDEHGRPREQVNMGDPAEYGVR